MQKKSNETVTCDKCDGSGRWYGRGIVENGVFKGTIGVCYPCRGKGVQTPADQRRNWAYWKYYARISA